MWGIYCLAEELLASQEGLCSMELVSRFCGNCFVTVWCGVFWGSRIAEPRAMGWTIWGLIPVRGKRFFLLLQKLRAALRSTHPPIQGVSGVLLNWLRYEGDHSPSFNAKVNKMGKVCKTQLYQLMTLVAKVIMVTRKSMLTLVRTVTKVKQQQENLW